jgi:hypothetical protein
MEVVVISEELDKKEGAGKLSSARLAVNNLADCHYFATPDVVSSNNSRSPHAPLLDVT